MGSREGSGDDSGESLYTMNVLNITELYTSNWLKW